jgi:hypothetical protein
MKIAYSGLADDYIEEAQMEMLKRFQAGEIPGGIARRLDSEAHERSFSLLLSQGEAIWMQDRLPSSERQ